MLKGDNPILELIKKLPVAVSEPGVEYHGDNRLRGCA